jgi:hypothetical protein
MNLTQQIQTFNTFTSKGKKAETKGRVVFTLPKLKKEEHDTFYKSIYQKVSSAEFCPKTKTYTYVISRKSGIVEINLIEKRKYTKNAKKI